MHNIFFAANIQLCDSIKSLVMDISDSVRSVNDGYTLMSNVLVVYLENKNVNISLCDFQSALQKYNSLEEGSACILS
jgi:hypothetical protein